MKERTDKMMKLMRRLFRSNHQTESIPLQMPQEGRISIPLLEQMPDEELRRLNEMLPWSAFVVDSTGRRFGRAHSGEKRNAPQEIPDRRILLLDQKLPLKDRRVLEIGCFEGIHTVALAQRANVVVAVDSRIDNVVKTVVRCAMFDLRPQVLCWDVEVEPPPRAALECDVLHHVGVLYHLADPWAHLQRVCNLTRELIMLDTHVSPPDAQLRECQTVVGPRRFFPYKEGGRSDPFSGMQDHAKWLPQDDLIDLLRTFGFSNVEVAERRDERNGPRVLIFAQR